MSTLSPIVIIGFGSQAKAWALNLKDSKIDVSIALLAKSKNKEKAEAMGFNCVELETEQLKKFSTFIMLIPDDQHLSLFEKNKNYINPRSHFIYAHGFSLSKEKLHEKYAQFNHSLLAPKAIASEVRFQFEIKGKIGAAYYTFQPQLEDELKELSQLVGFTSIYKSHFDEECIADLFSEQSLLCSLIPYGSLKSYNLLRKKGISPEVAFMECFLELKSISQAFVTLGPEAFFKLISPNALIGSQKGRKLLLSKDFDNALESIYNDIETKKFYDEINIDVSFLREEILKEWSNEELSKTYLNLKDELI